MSCVNRPGRMLRVVLWLTGFAGAVLVTGGIYWARSETGRGVTSDLDSPVLARSGSSPNPSVRTGLSSDERQYLWEIENKAFQISYKVGPALCEAVAQQDRAALATFLHAQFAGQVFDSDSVEVVQRDFAVFRYQRSAEHARRPATRDQFVDWLLDQARLFCTTPQVQLALLNLSPIERSELSGPWKGTWTIRLSGEAGQLAEPSAEPPAVTKNLFPSRYYLGKGEPLEVSIRGEFRCESLPEDPARDRGWITSWTLEETTVARAQRKLMEEISLSSAGIDAAAFHDNWKCERSDFLTTPGGVYACDYNGDGIVDLLITDREYPMLFAGRGDATFSDATLAAGLPWGKDRAGVAAFADLDNDGDEDLILGVAILENRNGQFTPRGHLPLTPEATGIAVADYDNDGLIDLYVSNAAPAPQRAGVVGKVSWVDDDSGMPNVLWRNRGGFQFENVTDFAQAGGGRRSTFTSLWLDADDDGLPDLYVINELGPNVLLRNNGNGTFEEHHIGPPFDGFTMGAVVGDINEDGKIDIYLGNMKSKVGQRIVANLPADAYPAEILDKMRRWVAGNLLLFNRGNLRFTDSPRYAAGNGWSYGPTLVDLDGDGRLDIHATCGFASFSRQEPDG